MIGLFGKARPQAAAGARRTTRSQRCARPPSPHRNGALPPAARARPVRASPQAAPGAPGGGQGFGGGQFNPQAFQQVRAKFCTPERASTVPTLTGPRRRPPEQLDRAAQEPRRHDHRRALGRSARRHLQRQFPASRSDALRRDAREDLRQAGRDTAADHRGTARGAAAADARAVLWAAPTARSTPSASAAVARGGSRSNNFGQGGPGAPGGQGGCRRTAASRPRGRAR